MLNKIIAIAILVWLASELVSWANPPKYELQPTWHTVRAGETFWSISADYFDEQERFDSMNEWTYWVRKVNAEKMLGKKFLPIGMVLDIPIEKRVK